MARISPLCMAMLALSFVTASGQELPAFEVASVRLTPTQTVSSRMTEKSVSVIQPLRLVLLTAFGINEYLPVNDHRLSGPGWLNDVWVEINATIPPGKTLKQVPDMFRRLLIERFGLVAHTETRMVDGYQLMVGPSGIKMKEVEAVNDLDKSFDGQFTASGKPKPDTLRGSPEGATRTISIERGVRRITSRTMYDQTQSSARTTIIDAARMTMAELEPIIAFNLDKPVVDRTGLAGVYQFKIELPPDAAPLRIFGIPGTPQPTGVSTFKALEGLGLKLERQPTPVEVIVVDKIDRTPTAN